MPTLERYDSLMSDRKYHGAAREACLKAAEAIRGQNSGSTKPRVTDDALKNDLPETVTRYLHAARRAVLEAIAEVDRDQLRAIARDKAIWDALDDETLRGQVEDAIPTIPG